MLAKYKNVSVPYQYFNINKATTEEHLSKYKLLIELMINQYMN